MYEEVRFEVIAVPDAPSEAVKDRFVIQMRKFGNDAQFLVQFLVLGNGDNLPLLVGKRRFLAGSRLAMPSRRLQNAVPAPTEGKVKLGCRPV